MSTVFGEYAEYYNSFYAEKDYVGEAGYIRDLLASMNVESGALLDMGCGTGRHALILESYGFSVTGFDLSEEMIAIARELRSPDSAATFQVGNVKSFRVERKFSAVVSLFHVASYQTTNDDFLKFLETAKSHMDRGSVFIFDFWFSSAVLSQKPAVRTKSVSSGGREYLRIATPDIREDSNIVDVNYRILSLDKGQGIFSEFSEVHSMRHFSLPEIKMALDLSGMKFLSCEEWLTRRQPSSDTWGVVVAAALK